MDSIEAYFANVAPAHNSNYKLLVDCYLAGLIDEFQWMQHMKDEVFARWIKKNYPQGI